MASQSVQLSPPPKPRSRGSTKRSWLRPQGHGHLNFVHTETTSNLHAWQACQTSGLPLWATSYAGACATCSLAQCDGDVGHTFGTCFYMQYCAGWPMLQKKTFTLLSKILSPHFCGGIDHFVTLACKKVNCMGIGVLYVNNPQPSNP